ncbi:hypothetical protein TWF696_005005 [Orbilia brochopaga]|uniref:Cas1p 10 TM acyl transferase domain-containing protein n=1 Tax=Orbilia brochopaga TaxID=3140254 RepID=A0AAV9V0N7_9PEZI
MDGRRYTPAQMRPQMLQAAREVSADVYVPPAGAAATADIPPSTTTTTNTTRRKEDEEEEFGPVDVVTPVFHALAAFAIAVLVFLTVQRFLFDDARDPYKCAAVTNEGRWLENADPLGPPLRTWQPRGCILHPYSAADIAACIPNRRILFVGDRSLKSVYRAFARKFKHGGPPELPTTLTSRTDEREVFLEFGGSVTLEFVYDPFLNSSRLLAELQPWHNGSVSDSSGYDKPALLIVSAGIAYATNPPVDVNPQRLWHRAIDTVASHMRYGPRPTFLGGRDTLLLAPVEHPAWEKLPHDERGRLDPHLAIDINRYVHELATVQGVDVLRSWRVASDDERVDSVVPNHKYSSWHSKATAEDGWTLLPEVAERRVDMVMNLRCNAVLAEAGRRVSSACCVRYRRPGWVQRLLVFAALSLPMVRLYNWLVPSSKMRTIVPEGGLLRQLWQLSLALVLCFYADRTPVFDKANKLLLPEKTIRGILAGIGVFGALTMQRPKDGAAAREVEARIAGECRGVALAVYMLGSYLAARTGLAETAACALLFVRVAEWTVGLLKDRGGVSAVSFVEEVVKINLLAVTVAVMMRDRYALFGLPAAYTFWCAVAMATVRVSGGKNRVAAVYMGKLVVSAALVAGCVGNRTLMTAVWKVATAGGLGGWEVEEVRRAVLRDVWPAYGGMAAGAVYIAWSRLSMNVKGGGDIANSVAAGLAGLAVFSGCYLVVTEVRDPTSMYTSLARMAMYGGLRYAVGVLRRRQSTAMVWLGSLEAAVLALMPHAWLAADGEGVVDLGIWGTSEVGSLWNAGVWTTAMVYVCWGVRDAFLGVAGWAMGGFGSKEVDGRRLASVAGLLWFANIMQQ